MSVLLETSVGDIVIDLHHDLAPRACLNFLKLCKLKSYNDTHIFSIERGFVARFGDPRNDGTGGHSVHALCDPPGASHIAAEPHARLTHARAGTVSMTTAVSGGHGSQFFVTLKDGLRYLDAAHTVFATVAEGLAVVTGPLASAPVDANNRPLRMLRLRHTIVLHDPFDDPPGLPAPPPSPPPDQTVPDDRLHSDDEDADEGNGSDSDGETVRRLEAAAHAEREARARAEVLEMVGDIRDADLEPPDNVLFLCKLNPVTRSSDLETIFARFGECTADVLRDRNTGESLCYGFVEFDSKERCERAFYKMDGAIVDFRQIRVDFSQSVSKLWNRARRDRLARNGPPTRKRPAAADEATSGRAAVTDAPPSSNHPGETKRVRRRFSRFDQMR